MKVTNMKRLLMLAVVIATMATSGFAKGVNIGVVVPDQTTDGVSASAFKSLGTKLERMISSNGGTTENSGNIVLFPVLNFVKDDLIEGGMRNINNIEIELTIKAVSMNANTVFGTVTWTLQGKGYGKSQAVQEAFNKLASSDQKFAKFYETVTPKIEKYFVANRSSLLAKAKSLAAQGQYEEGMAMLYDYPQGAAGYNEVQTTISSIYKQCLKANCSKAIQQARARFAVQDYEGAVALLSDVEATSGCATEANALSNQIRQKINSDQKAERQQELSRQRIAASVEKARINAVSNMVSAYYRSRPRVTYNTLIVHRW